MYIRTYIHMYGNFEYVFIDIFMNIENKFLRSKFVWRFLTKI